MTANHNNNSSSIFLRLIVAAYVSAVAVASTCQITETFTEDAEGNQLSAGTLIDDTFPMHYATYAARRSQDNRPGRAFDDGMLFDARTSPSQTRDLDLIQDPSRGNMLIIAKKRFDTANPDDNGRGGTITGTFEGPVTMVSITFIDIEARSTIRFYGPSGYEIEEMSIPGGVDGQVRVIPMNVDNVSKFSITITGSGAFDDVTFLRPRTADLPCPDEPTLAPTPGAPAISCVPTTGPCVASYDTLSAVASLAVEYDTIAVCGGANIETPAPIEITQPGVTLCCDAADGSNEKCTITSIDRQQQNLKVTGESFTLSGLVFIGGFAQEGEFLGDGGNVEIKADGDHSIVDCEFYAGTARRWGGNLFVASQGSVLLERCRIESGSGESSGGGASIITSASVHVIGSEFVDNHAEIEGGGLHLSCVDEVVIQENKFEANTADFGGGFIATMIGEMSNLKVLMNTFVANEADANGGAAAIDGFGSLDIPLIVAGNTGEGNVVTGDAGSSIGPCDDISFYLAVLGGGELDVCISIADQFP